MGGWEGSRSDTPRTTRGDGILGNEHLIKRTLLRHKLTTLVVGLVEGIMGGGTWGIGAGAMRRADEGTGVGWAGAIMYWALEGRFIGQAGPQIQAPEAGQQIQVTG